MRHNAQKSYMKKVSAGDSLHEALKVLVTEGKKTGNSKITGFIKVVENTFFNDVRLDVILENWLRARKG